MTDVLPTNDDAPRTPLTLEFAPERLEGDTQAKPVAVIEPSFQHDGRIFIGIHPFGRRLGLHVLPDDARRIRDHLSKLLLEPTPEVPAEDRAEAVDWQQRIRDAAERAAASKRPPRRPKRKRLQFRLEFSIGSIQGVVGRMGD